MTNKETIIYSINSLNNNLLRTIITCLIISLGIMALVGILTAIDAMKVAINSNFATMGSNSFNIRNKAYGFNSNKNKRIVYSNITFSQANLFKEKFIYKSSTSISSNVDFAATLSFEGKKTNPNILVQSIDDNYIKVTGYEIAKGINFLEHENYSASNFNCIIGDEIVKNLFLNNNPIGKQVSYKGIKFTIIGVLKSKGKSLGMGAGDRLFLIPLALGRTKFLSDASSYTITTQVNSISAVENAVNESISLMRNIRNLKTTDENNFEITKSDALANKVIESLGNVQIAASFIAIITLLGAAIGLMNIMLVSVTERTREIGTLKAIGATQSDIKKQFLTESVVICQLGGFAGILLGILLGNSVSSAFNVGFIVPWNWILLALIVCFIVGVASGYYPAKKASHLDPIEALRHE